MTIRTQQFNVAFVGCPVLEAAVPCVSGLRPDLGLRVNVVDVERAVVIEPAANALAAELANECQLALPIARMLVNGRAILIPESLLTFGRAKLRGAPTAAFSALAVTAPSRCQIAGLAAVFSCAVFDAVLVHLKRFAAVLAVESNARFLHAHIIAKYTEHRNSRYFDMFVTPPAKPVQEALI
jgi:hypothetical protein